VAAVEIMLVMVQVCQVVLAVAAPPAAVEEREALAHWVREITVVMVTQQQVGIAEAVVEAVLARREITEE
jgi:hypothetical protein